MTTRVRARLALPLLLVATVTVTGCAGPKQRLDYAGKSVPINVAFGKPPAAKGATPAPGTVLQPVPSGVGVVPVVPGSGTGVSSAVPTPALPTTTPVACPAQDPLKFPRREATNVVTGDVPEGQFPYRVSGSYTDNGRKTAYEQVVFQTVKRLSPDPAGRTRFSVHYDLLGIAYTLVYVVTPPPDPSIPGEIGLESLVQNGANGDGASFMPAKPLRQLQLRAERGVTWTDATTDPLSASSATADGVISDKSRINACGQPVEAWKVQLTQRIITPGQDITATRTVHFATGYGGLLVGEHVSYTGTAGGGAVSGESTMLINIDPGAS